MAMLAISASAILLSPLCVHKSRDKKEMLYAYNTGTVLYFKAIKFFGCLFLALALLAVPTLFCFIAGTAFKNDEFKSVEQLAWGGSG